MTLCHLNLVQTHGQSPPCLSGLGATHPLTNARVPAALGLSTEHTGEEDPELAVEEGHIAASEYLEGVEGKREK